MARATTALMLAHLEGQAVLDHRVFPSRLIVRGSTAPPAVVLAAAHGGAAG